MRGLAILLAFDFLGMALQAGGVPLPGNVLGLILFTLCLFLGIVKLQWVEESANFLLRHMLLFFAPVIVGVIVYRDRISQEWPAMTAGLVGSLLVALLVTGWAAQALLTRANAKSSGAPARPRVERGMERQGDTA